MSNYDEATRNAMIAASGKPPAPVPDPDVIEAIRSAQTQAEALAVHTQITQAASNADILAAQQAANDKLVKKPWYARTETWWGLFLVLVPNICAVILSPATLGATLPLAIGAGATFIFKNMGLSQTLAEGVAQVGAATAQAIANKSGGKA